MARGTTTPEAKVVREKLLTAALEEFGDKGFSGARLDEIASVAGTNKQTIVNHFGSKEGIFAAAVKEAYQRLRAPDQAIKDHLKNLEPKRALHDLIEHLFKPSVVTVQFQRVMHDENRFEAVHAREFPEIKRSYSDLFAIITDILDRGERSGVFRSGVDPKELYIFLAGVLVYRLTNAHTLSTMLGLSLDTDEGARRSRENAIEFILDVLRPTNVEGSLL